MNKVWPNMCLTQLNKERNIIIMMMMNRVEICRDRRDLRSCKIYASCVNFSKKTMRTSTKFKHTKGDLTLKLLKFYTFS